MEYDELATLLRLAFGSVLEPGSARYVAGPLATGRAFYEQQAAGTLELTQLRDVNTAAMRAFAVALRRSGPDPVIDPGLLRVSSWDGAQHGDFFLGLLGEFSRQVVLMGDWEFSSGATKEFVYATAHDIECVNAAGQRVTLADGRRLITSALTTVRGLGLTSASLERRLAALAW